MRLDFVSPLNGDAEKLTELLKAYQPIRNARKEIETLKRQNQATDATGGVNIGDASTKIHNEKHSTHTAMLTKANPMIAEIAGSPF